MQLNFVVRNLFSFQIFIDAVVFGSFSHPFDWWEQFIQRHDRRRSIRVCRETYNAWYRSGFLKMEIIRCEFISAHTLASHSMGLFTLKICRCIATTSRRKNNIRTHHIRSAGGTEKRKRWKIYEIISNSHFRFSLLFAQWRMSEDACPRPLPIINAIVFHSSPILRKNIGIDVYTFRVRIIQVECMWRFQVFSIFNPSTELKCSPSVSLSLSCFGINRKMHVCVTTLEHWRWCSMLCAAITTRKYWTLLNWMAVTCFPSMLLLRESISIPIELILLGKLDAQAQTQDSSCSPYDNQILNKCRFHVEISASRIDKIWFRFRSIIAWPSIVPKKSTE